MDEACGVGSRSRFPEQQQPVLTGPIRFSLGSFARAAGSRIDSIMRFAAGVRTPRKMISLRSRSQS